MQSKHIGSLYVIWTHLMIIFVIDEWFLLLPIELEIELLL
jgi:hypothetical protein